MRRRVEGVVLGLVVGGGREMYHFGWAVGPVRRLGLVWWVFTGFEWVGRVGEAVFVVMMGGVGEWVFDDVQSSSLQLYARPAFAGSWMTTSARAIFAPIRRL